MRRRNRPTEDPLRLFTDRSLGRHIVPDALRAAGADVVTMAELYPETEELVADEQWIHDATEAGLVVLMKDDRIRRRPRERAAILDSAARAFVITNANLTGPQMANLLVSNLNRIALRARHPGPYIYGIYPLRLERLFPR